MMEPLCHLIGVNPNKLSEIENVFLEAELLTRICDELIEEFRTQYKSYFNLMKFSKYKENKILKLNFSYFIVNDILATKEYTLSGIAYYIQIDEDQLIELIALHNTTLSTKHLRNIIELHRSVRASLYKKIMKNIMEKYLTVHTRSG